MLFAWASYHGAFDALRVAQKPLGLGIMHIMVHNSKIEVLHYKKKLVTHDPPG